MLKNKGSSGEGDKKNKFSKKQSKQDKDELTYSQTPLHVLDQVRQPSSAKLEKHAVSAADILNDSLSNLDKSSNHHKRQSSKDNNSSQGHRNASFLLQGSATSLLKPGSEHEVSARRRSYSEIQVGNVAATQTSSASSQATSPIPEGQRRTRRATTGKTREKQYTIQESFSRDLTEGASSRGLDTSESIRLGERSSSIDSYDPDVTGTGLVQEAPEGHDVEQSGDTRQRAITRQVSVLSGKESCADASLYSDDDDDEFAGSVSTEGDIMVPFSCCGRKACHVRKCIKANRIASAVVRYAPCFWCFPTPVSATDRTVLTRLNIISAFFATGQIVATAWMVTVMLIPPEADQNTKVYYQTHGMGPNLWSLTGSMYAIGFFGLIIFVSNIVTLKIIQVVNLVGAVRYLWALLYMLPFQIFFVLSILDFYDVTHVWVKHSWPVPSMAWFRETYCAPGTAGTLCLVPIYPADAEYNETDWCLEFYQATNCTQIRNEAQIELEDMLMAFYTANLVWGILGIIILLLIVNTLERIISRPMVQKSRESNVPGWLSLPTIGCSVVGAVFRYSPSSVLSAHSGSSYSWIGTAYMACGVLFFITAMLGWFISTFSILSGRDKRYKHISVIVFISFMICTSFVLTVIFVASISYSVALVDIPIDEDQVENIACGVDTADSCSNCDGAIPNEPLCPEWSLEDVTRVLQNQTKGSATLAIIFFLYSFGALRFGFVLRKHVTMYQIDYV